MATLFDGAVSGNAVDRHSDQNRDEYADSEPCEKNEDSDRGPPSLMPALAHALRSQRERQAFWPFTGSTHACDGPAALRV